jgi:hypothetical protein
MLCRDREFPLAAWWAMSLRCDANARAILRSLPRVNGIPAWPTGPLRVDYDELRRLARETRRMAFRLCDAESTLN